MNRKYSFAALLLVLPAVAQGQSWRDVTMSRQVSGEHEVRDARPEIAFVMTDSLPDELAERAQAEGAYAILTKPFDLHQVRSTIERLLQVVNAR